MNWLQFKSTFIQHAINHSIPGDEHRWMVEVPDGADSYEYYLNICGDVGIDCPSDSKGVAACQKKSGEKNFGKVIGKTSNQMIRYFSYTYRNLYCQIACITFFHDFSVVGFLLSDGWEGKSGSIFTLSVWTSERINVKDIY